jgi:PAS domain S-box-containing protein
LSHLLKEYPFIVDFLADYKPEFRKLRNPMTRRVLARAVTLEDVASMGGVPFQKLASDVAEALKHGLSKASDANARKEALKSIVKELHQGSTPETLKARFAQVLGDVSPVEIGRLEQELVREGLDPEAITKLCDLHVQLFQEGLEKQAELNTGTQHPLTILRSENQQIARASANFLDTINQLRTSESAVGPVSINDRISEKLEALAKVEAHYQRKENQLFPFLEKRGITAPTQVMWSVHDEVRTLIKETRASLKSGNIEAVLDKGEGLAHKIDDMIFKEEKIMFPMAMEALTSEDWEKMSRPSSEREASKTIEGLLSLDTGKLGIEQLNLILTHLPVDLTFIDENDVVRYYSEGRERIFVRTPEIIGRKVQNCHPPKSVHIVNEILQEFRAGKRDLAEFWINLQGKSVHIRYFAVRNKDRRYAGTLEVTQDITSIKTLQGERRLLDWQ